MLERIVRFVNITDQQANDIAADAIAAELLDEEWRQPKTLVV